MDVVCQSRIRQESTVSCIFSDQETNRPPGIAEILSSKKKRGGGFSYYVHFVECEYELLLLDVVLAPMSYALSAIPVCAVQH